jgi:hypothetical protein
MIAVPCPTSLCCCGFYTDHDAKYRDKGILDLVKGKLQPGGALDLSNGVIAVATGVSERPFCLFAATGCEQETPLSQHLKHGALHPHWHREQSIQSNSRLYCCQVCADSL